MKKTITVTADILENLHPYQEQNKAMPNIGDILEVHGGKIPKVRVEGYFVQVTNWQPNANSLHMIERRNSPEAKKYGWDKGAETTQQIIKERTHVAAFERWSLDYKFVK